MTIWRLVIGLMLLGGVVACGDPPPPAAGPITPEERARAAVARRLELPVAQVAVISIAARNFADSSLDCPEPDMAYQQVITPGHQVIVEADGRRFDVRVAGAAAKICHRRKGRSPPQPSASRASVTELAAIARADLASRLPASMADITVMGVRALRDGDELRGCEIDCNTNGQICGYSIGLLHHSRRYDYLARGGKVQPCPAILPG
jgi:hypothetical protein